MKQKVLRNTSAYMLAGLIPYAVNFFMLPVYTRFLTPDDYGALALLNTFSAFLLTFLSLQMGNSFVRFYYDMEDSELPAFVSTVLYASVALNLLMLAPFLVFGGAVTRFLFPTSSIPFHPYVVFAIGGAFFSALVMNFNMLLRVQERGTAVLVLAGVNAAGNTLLQVWFVVVLGWGAPGVLAAIALNSAVILAAQLWMLRSCLSATCRLALLGRAISYSWPLIPQALSSVLLVYTDKLILGYFVPLAQIGLYNIGQRFAAVLELLVRSFKDANAPMFMRGSLTDRAGTVELYRRLITRWAALMTVAYLGIAFFSREVIMLLTTPAYHGAQVFVPALAGAFLFRGLYFFCVNALLFEKRTLAIVWITLAAGALNVAGNWLAIPRFGAIGAAYVTLLAHGVTFALAFWAIRKVYPLRFEWLKLGEIFGLAALCVVAMGRWAPDGLVAGLAMKALVLFAYAAYVLARHIGNPLHGGWRFGPGERK